MPAWNEEFKNYPQTGMYASVSAQAINEFLLLFKEMFSVQHEWSDLTAPTLIHRIGECGIVEMVPDDETPISHSVEGGLQYQVTDDELFRDNGATLDGPINSRSHGSLIGLLDDDHTQYITVDNDPLITSLTVGAIENLDEAEMDYVDWCIMPRVLHMGNDATTGSKHDDDSVTSLGYEALLGSDKLNEVEETLYSGTLTDGSHVEVNPGADYCFFPWDEVTSPGPLQMVELRAYFTGSIAGITDNYPRFILHNPMAFDTTFALKCMRVVP